jgi:tetratricopeptide (TPR) repeat protein
MKRTVVAVFLTSMIALGQSATAACPEEGYEAGLCLYSEGRWEEAEAALEAAFDPAEKRPETLKALYFLGRTKMRLGGWQEASDIWIRLFHLSPAFYRQWNGDFLLGTCRRNLGLS